MEVPLSVMFILVYFLGALTAFVGFVIYGMQRAKKGGAGERK
jgi:hypothetical protein